MGKVWRLYADYSETRDIIKEWHEEPKEQDVTLAIKAWCDERHWGVPYWRIWTDSETNETWYDIGSWSTLIVFKEGAE